MDLLQSFEIRPVTVIGHSSGEIAAAYGPLLIPIYLYRKLTSE